MREVKLKYTDKEAAIADLITKGIQAEVEDTMSFAEGVHAVVYIGKIVLTNGTYNEVGEELTTPVYADGYHVDLLLSDEVTTVFPNEIFPNSESHSFAGINEFKEEIINVK